MKGRKGGEGKGETKKKKKKRTTGKSVAGSPPSGPKRSTRASP
jgi:hypothetical protein